MILFVKKKISCNIWKRKSNNFWKQNYLWPYPTFWSKFVSDTSLFGKMPPRISLGIHPGILTKISSDISAEIFQTVPEFLLRFYLGISLEILYWILPGKPLGIHFGIPTALGFFFSISAHIPAGVIPRTPPEIPPRILLKILAEIPPGITSKNYYQESFLEYLLVFFQKFLLGSLR